MKIARRSLLAGVASVPVSASAKSIKINDLQSEINKAIQDGGVVQLPAGNFAIAKLKINGSVWLQGVPGHTKLISLAGGPVVEINAADKVSISGIEFVGKDVPSTDELSRSALLMARNARNLRIEDCSFIGSPFTGVSVEGCSGRIRDCNFHKLQNYGLFAIDSAGLEISSNTLSDIGNNGIMVWRSEIGEDGSQVFGNRISHIRADAGGSGQNGNGINIFRAGNVMTSNNHVSDVAFSGIRYNSGSNALITGNTLLRSGEAALFVEFNYQGAVVTNNIIDQAAWGISITNLDVGGRLAVCSGNIVRNIKGGLSEAAGEATGITAEADTIVSQNILEDIGGIAIRLGWGPYARNLSAQGNIIRHCRLGVVVSTTQGAGQSIVGGNLIEGAQSLAIAGLDHNDVTTDDLSVIDAKVPPHVSVFNNRVTS
jgi:uncharacterized secreted repeat protein (TIGR03808 family)